MTARFSLSVLVAACVMWPSVASAQGYSQPAPGYPQGYSQPVSGYPQAGPGYSPGGYPAGGYAPAAAPAQFAGTYSPQPGVDIYGNGAEFQPTTYQTNPLPWERGGRTPFRQFLTEVLPNSYFRVEYLSWDVDDVGSRAVGAPTLLQNGDVLHPIPFGVFNTNDFTGRNLTVPRTGQISFNKTSGRGSPGASP